MPSGSRVETVIGRKQSAACQNVSSVSGPGESGCLRGTEQANQHQGAQALAPGDGSCGCETTCGRGSEGSGPGDDPGVIADRDPDWRAAEPAGFGCLSGGEEDPFGGGGEEPDGKSRVLERRCLSGTAGMDEETGRRQTVAHLRSRAKLYELYRRPGDVSAVPEEGRDRGEGLFVTWSSAHLCHGVVECRDAD